MKILIIEDEPKVASFISLGLQEHGYETDVAFDGFMGKKLALSETFDLILLDLNLPYINGLDLCFQIKNDKPDLPILMLTALGATSDKVKGFNAGADDYLVKPFEFVELLARLKAISKRFRYKSESEKLIVANIELDLNKKIAIRDQKEIELTAKEFALLEYFMRNKGRVLSRNSISEEVWDIDFDTETNVVDVYVNMLRKKIERGFSSKVIHTRIGMGYIFDEE